MDREMLMQLYRPQFKWIQAAGTTAHQ